MLKNPPTSYHGLPPTPFEQKVYHVALPVCISVSHVGASHAQDCGEHAGFMFLLVMQGIKAVVAQLANVDRRTVRTRNSHKKYVTAEQPQTPSNEAPESLDITTSRKVS